MRMRAWALVVTTMILLVTRVAPAVADVVPPVGPPSPPPSVPEPTDIGTLSPSHPVLPFQGTVENPTPAALLNGSVTTTV